MHPIGLSCWLAVVLLLCEHHVASRSPRYDLNQPCTIPGLQTPQGPLTAGCRYDCMISKNRRLRNGITCLDIGINVVKRMVNYLNYSCPLGTCSRGVCIRRGINVLCQKYPVYWIPPPK
uniref:Evasin n=1 Tax=Amblyomma parvum TaxID=251391 RepID=A0A023FZ70_AMBPA